MHAPFTDTILREMAINFPQSKYLQSMIPFLLTMADEAEMLEIPNIDPDKIARYGKTFLNLIRNAHRGYEAMMQQNEDRPQDPNHVNVIDISSDDDHEDAGDLDEFDGEEESQEECRPSRYFQSSVDPEVDAFNARSRCFQLQLLDWQLNIGSDPARPSSTLTSSSRVSREQKSSRRPWWARRIRPWSPWVQEIRQESLQWYFEEQSTRRCNKKSSSNQQKQRE